MGESYTPLIYCVLSGLAPVYSQITHYNFSSGTFIVALKSAIAVIWANNLHSYSEQADPQKGCEKEKATFRVAFSFIRYRFKLTI